MFLSVIIPVFNTQPKYLQECLSSIQLLHSLCRYEVILVNDGSTDLETCQFLDTLSPTFNVQIINQNNAGVSNARNTAIKHATGKFIFPLDADDRINPNIIHFIQYIKKYPDTEIIYGDLSIFGDQIKIVKMQPFHKYDLWFFENKLPSCSIYQKSVWERISGYDETMQTCEDWDFWCRCAWHDIQFTYLPYSNYDYRIIQNGQSLIQQTAHLIPEHHQKILTKIPLTAINKTEYLDYINQNLRQQLKAKRRKSIAIFLYCYFPKLFYWLSKKGLFSYKDRFFTL